MRQDVIPGLGVGPGRVIGLTGAPQSGKTPLGLMMALCVATGHPLLDMPVHPGRVTYLAYEGATLVHRKMKRIARGLGVRGAVDSLSLLRPPEGGLDAEAAVMLMQASASAGVRMVVIDSYHTAVQDGHSDTDVLRLLGCLSTDSGVAVVMLMPPPTALIQEELQFQIAVAVDPTDHNLMTVSYVGPG